MTTQSHLDATQRTWKRRDVPLVFLLHHNQRKLKSANPVTRQGYQEWHDVWCVLFPTGEVFIHRNYVNSFPSMTAFKDHCAQVGDYEIQWVQEMESEAQP